VDVAPLFIVKTLFLSAFVSSIAFKTAINVSLLG
jgi:hypothetical protein